jgi:hypothetical protein
MMAIDRGALVLPLPLPLALMSARMMAIEWALVLPLASVTVPGVSLEIS